MDELGPSTIEHRGPHQLPYKARGVMCPDGQRRTVKLHSEADTFWTIRGHLTYQGKCVSGAVMHQLEDTAEHLDLKFIPSGKNAYVFEKYGNRRDRP